MNPASIVFLATLTGCAAATAADVSAPTTPAAEVPAKAEPNPMTAAGIRQHLAFLADDAQQGRPPGSEADQRVQAYLVQAMKDAGLAPGFADGFRQSFEVTDGVRLSPGQTLRFEVGGAPIASDLLPFSHDTSASGPVVGKLVFVGYGISGGAKDGGDYKGLAKAVRGNIVVALAGGPDDPHIGVAERRGQSKAIAARDHGAAGFILWDPDATTAFPNHGEATDLGLPAVFVGQGGTEALRRALGGARQKAATLPGGVKRGQASRAKATLHTPVERVVLMTANVAGLIPGQSHDREIIIGAHMDHLGLGTEGSLAPGERAVHNGADDNASGVAVLLELCKAIAQVDLAKRPFDVRCVAFGAEEMGLLGSKHFVARLSPEHRKRIVAMFNFDMVGRLGPDGLVVAGAGTSTLWPKLIAEASGSLTVRTTDDGYGPSDHGSFYEAQIPVLHFFTGPHEDYHKPSDDLDKINVPGALQVAQMALAMVEAVQAGGEPPPYVAVARPAPRGGAGFRVSLGTIPDYGAKVDGVRLSAVRAGGAAEAAGMQKGDIIQKIGEREIHNLDDYMASFAEMKPDQAVPVVVERAGATVWLTLVPAAPKPH